MNKLKNLFVVSALALCSVVGSTGCAADTDEPEAQSSSSALDAIDKNVDQLSMCTFDAHTPISSNAVNGRVIVAAAAVYRCDARRFSQNFGEVSYHLGAHLQERGDGLWKNVPGADRDFNLGPAFPRGSQGSIQGEVGSASVVPACAGNGHEGAYRLRAILYKHAQTAYTDAILSRVVDVSAPFTLPRCAK